MRKKPRSRRRRRYRGGSRYKLIPLTALLIFAVCFAVLKLPPGTLPTISLPKWNLSLPKLSLWGGSSSAAFPTAPDDARDIAETGLPTEALPQTTPAGNIKNITIDSKGAVFIQNSTKFKLDNQELLSRKLPVTLTKKGVQVLIVSTHGAESYTPTATETYTHTEVDRTTDNNFNVIRVGKEMADVLNANGISTMQITELFDTPSYNGSYTRALNAITKAIKENPSIKVVIDVHRDYMETKEGVKYKTTAMIDGKETAQLMFVTGTSQSGLSHDNWEQNLSFQMKIQERMNTKYPGIMRPMLLREGRYNQHVSPGSMLVECGTSGNSLGEALSSARLFAQTLAEMLK